MRCVAMRSGSASFSAGGGPSASSLAFSVSVSILPRSMSSSAWLRVAATSLLRISSASLEARALRRVSSALSAVSFHSATRCSKVSGVACASCTFWARAGPAPVISASTNTVRKCVMKRAMRSPVLSRLQILARFCRREQAGWSTAPEDWHKVELCAQRWPWCISAWFGRLDLLLTEAMAQVRGKLGREAKSRQAAPAATVLTDGRPGLRP